MVLRNPQSVRLNQVSNVLHKAYKHGGGTVLVDGDSGMGKTYLLRIFAQQARQHGTWPLTSVNVDEIESGEPYSFIERFLASGIALDWDFRPDEGHQPLTIARQCVRRILDFAADSGIIIVIDDTHWIDAESMKVLRHMVPRLSRRNVLFICASRTPHAPGSLAELLANSAAMNPDYDHHLPLTSLTNDEIRELARAQFGVDISQRHADQLLEATGGSFLGIDTIFGQISPEEMQQLHTSWELPIRRGRTKNVLLGPYEQLSKGAQQVVQIVCWAGHEISYDTLVAAGTALGVPCELDEALESEVITETGFGHRIVPYHSQTAAAVRDVIDPKFAQKISAVLAELTTGYRSIRHRLLSTDSWSEQLEEYLREYVEEATELKQFANVTQILRMVLDFMESPEQRQHWITEMVLTCIRGKNGYECIDLLPEIETFPESMMREFMVLMLSLHKVQESFPRERVEKVLRATEITPDEAVLQAFVAFIMSMLTLRSPDRSPFAELVSIAKHHMSSGPQKAEELVDQRLAWMLSPQESTLLLECYELVQIHIEGKTDNARKILPGLMQKVTALPDIAIKIDCLTPLAGALIATGDVEQARDLAKQAVLLFQKVIDEPWTGGAPRIILAHTLVLLGEYQQAKVVLEHFDEISYEVLDLESRLTGTALRAKLVTIMGTQDPNPYLAFADKLNNLWWEFYGRDLMYIAQAELARSQGDDSKILQLTQDPVLEKMQNHQHGTLTYRVHALLNLEQLDAAATLIAELERRRGQTWYEYHGTLAWAKARYAELTGDKNAAHQHYKAALQERQFPLPWALTALDYGHWLVSTDQPQDAEKILESSIRQLEELGANAYVPKARRVLDRVVKRQEHAKGHVWATMTPREFEVAELLSKGLSNREIAQRLVVSEATARFHVSNILRKLQVSSRAEVPAIFQRSALQKPIQSNTKN